YRQLGRLVDRVACGLLELDVRPGDVVSFQLPNWWHFPVLVLACNRIGAVTNPIAMSLGRREVSFILERVESAVCVVPDSFRNTLSAALRSLPFMLGLQPDDVVLMASPLGHQTGYIYGCLTPMTMGMKAIYQDHWDAHRMLQLIQDEAATWTFSATTFVIDSV